MPHASPPARFAWLVLGYTIAVIVWGAYVRATGSGAGCGAHWPLCNGEIVPRSPGSEMLVELTHRVTSGVNLVLVGALGVVVWRRRPRRHPARTATTAAVVFVLAEALLGAGLVLFGLVAEDRSPARAVVLAVHLVNTFLLLASLALAAAWTDAPPRGRRFPGWLAAASLVACLVVAVSGVVAALGDTLFPVGSLAEGLAQDRAPTAHVLVRLRVHHPWLAVVLALLAGGLARAARSAGVGGAWPDALRATVVAQLAVGLATLLLLAPVWLQLVHLAVADLLWVELVLVAAALADVGGVRTHGNPRSARL